MSVSTREGIKDFESLHSFCNTCRKCRVAKKEGPVIRESGKLAYKTGDFIVPCKGIPEDFNYIPNYSEIKHHLDESDIEYSKALYDPVLWAKIHLDWEPRKGKGDVDYQGMALRCTSKRKVLRWGRRLGKTDTMAIAILHYLFTNSPTVKRWDSNQKQFVQGFSTVLVIAPYLNQVKVIFERLAKLIESNPLLQNEVKRNVASPAHTIELWNGAKVIGFPSGAKSGSGAASVRGQKADMIVLDETDYLQEQDLENILAMLMEHSDVTLWSASTPTGRREHFWRFCTERMDFKEFHYTSMTNPSWNEAMELELREFYSTELAWQHEILAEFGESASGVFQVGFVETALSDYRYDTQRRLPDWIYSVGVDWNDTENGTKIVVVGLSPETRRFRVVDKITVQKAGWTQTSSINKLIELNRVWKPNYIYVDEGYGSTQIEILKKYGMEAELRGDKVDAHLKNIKGINLSSKIDIYDPLTQAPSKEWIKPFMVNNSVRRFEQRQIEISKYDDLLYKQLLGYNISKVTTTGVPVYSPGPDGDHDLDGLMLSLLGFTMEMSEFTSVKYNGEIAIAGKLGEKSLTTEMLLANAMGREPNIESVITKKVERASEPESRNSAIENKSLLTQLPSVGTISKRIYSPEAFSSDRPNHAFSGYGKQKIRERPSRRKF